MFESLNGNSFEKVELPFSTENHEFRKLKDLIGLTFPLYGFFPTMGKFGKQYSLITDTCYINTPKWFTEKLDKFSDAEKSAIWGNGSHSITNIREIETKNGVSYTFDIVPTTPEEIPFN